MEKINVSEAWQKVYHWFKTPPPPFAKSCLFSETLNFWRGPLYGHVVTRANYIL